MTTERWRRTEELYHAALARPIAERTAYLAAASPDEAMRRDVESLLNELAADDRFLCEPVLVMAEHIVTDVTPIIGQRLGNYQIDALLGVGGMGEVYRARDTTLNRHVAIKLLPQAFTGDPDRLARLEREAHILASLNHPNICAIHELGETDSLRFLVLEFLEGKTLADSLGAASRRSPDSAGLSLEHALSLAQQIAAALEAAHERGVIHRDLKPANIIITPDGLVKVLDFGLAKTIPSEDSSTDLTDAGGAGPEAVRGVIGTAAYMSAEQASGKRVDRRTDIWSFGVVLFEMVTGRRPFAGETVSETLASVLKTEPPWVALPAGVTPDLRRLLRRCLEKDPKRRLQSIGEARVQIEDLLSGVSGESAGSLDLPRRRNVVPWIFAGALAIGLAGAVAWTLRQEALPVTRLGLALPVSQRLDGSGGGHIVALSPDGGEIAFVASPAAIYRRSMAKDDVKVISGTEGYGYGSVREPVFSPDGSSIAFFAGSDQTLKRIPVDGGVPVTICPAKSPYGMSWGPDGILFSQGSEGIMQVSADGGRAVQIVRVQSNEVAHGPQMLPGGRQVLFTLATGTAADRWDKAQIVVQSLQSGERTIVFTGGSDARYLPSGHIVYAVGGRLFAAVFDVRQLRSGDPVAIVDGVRRAAANYTGAANVSISNNGSLVYVPGPIATPDTLMDLALIDRQTGAVNVLNLPPRRYAWPRVSSDGERLAVTTEDGKEAAIWTYELSGTIPMQQLTSVGNNRFAVWTSSTSLAFQSDREGDLAIFRQSIGGRAERVTKPDQGTAHVPESWSAETNTLLFTVAKGSELSLWALSLQDGKKTLLTDISPSSATYAPGAAFSPDGRWVAYASAERGATTIYVQPFPSTGVRYPLNRKPAEGPHEPVWSPDGKELFYNPRLGGFEVVSVRTHPTFGFGSPVPLPRKFQMGPPGSRTNYDITPRGTFVGLITAGRAEYDSGSDERIEVVLNWVEEVKGRLARHVP